MCMLKKCTLESGINVASGTLGKKNKRSTLNKRSPTLNSNFLHIAKVKKADEKRTKKNPKILKILKLINVAHFNKNVAPGKKLKR